MKLPPFKVLSVSQPWTDRILFRGKTIETRFWYHPYRGLLALQATKRPQPGHPEYKPGGELAHRTGAILGLADLETIRNMNRADEALAQCSYEPGMTALVLKGKALLSKPVPCVGALGFFDPPEVVVKQVEDQLKPCESCKGQKIPGTVCGVCFGLGWTPKEDPPDLETVLKYMRKGLAGGVPVG